MDDPLFSVRDQVVLVSGGSRGIGRAIARAFCRRGSRVVLTGRSVETTESAVRELEGEGPVWGRACDVTGAVGPLVEEVIERHGRIDTLVNCAGINRRKPAEDLSEEDCDIILDTNLKGAWRLSREVGRHMIRQRSGCQIQIASINTDRPLRNVLPYAMSKGAMGQMTRALALEWGRTNTPLGRLGEPEDMAGTALFLASRAAAFMTGQILYVDGGFTSGWPWPIPE